MLCIRLSVQIRTSCILVFRVHTGVYEYIPGLSQYILLCTRFISVHTVVTVQGFVTVCTMFVSVHTGMYQVCLSTYCSGTLPHTHMYQHMLRMYKYVLDTDQHILVCTWCVPVHTWMYSTEACLTGCSGAHRDANSWMPDVPSTHRFAVL
jgi:hypothetical protein